MPDLVAEELLPPEALRACREWDRLSPDWTRIVDGIGEARFAPIDGPLIAAAHGDVVEVGCGDGRLLARLDDRRVRTVLGVDLSIGMVRLAHARGFRAVRGAAERLPLPDGSVDTVLAGYYALRFAQIDIALAEAARVLRPGGTIGFTLLGRCAVEVASFVASVPLLSRPASTWTAARTLLGRTRAALTTDVSSAAELRERLSRHGLRADRILGTPYVPGATKLILAGLGARVPYLREEAAARFGFDVIVLGTKDVIA